MTRNLAALTVLWLVAGATGRAEAGLLLSGSGGGFQAVPGSNDSSLGFEFKVGSQALSVTRLGMLDWFGEGLGDSHAVTLWDISGNLIATVTVPDGESAALDSGFRMVDLADAVTLAAGQSYVLGVTHQLKGGDPFALNSAAQMNSIFSSAATFVRGRVGLGSGLPANTSDFGLVGPNLDFTILSTAVPEPSTLISGGLAGLVGLGLARRHRRRTTVAA